MIDWLGCCCALESLTSSWGWLFGSLVRLLVDGIVVVLVSCSLRRLKVRIVCNYSAYWFSLTGITYRRLVLSSSVVASSIVVSLYCVARPLVIHWKGSRS